MLLLINNKFPLGNSTKSVSDTVCPLKIGNGFDHVSPWSNEKNNIISMSLTVSRRTAARIGDSAPFPHRDARGMHATRVPSRKVRRRCGYHANSSLTNG